MNYIKYGIEKIFVAAIVDTVIVGGGSAGVSAGISAAKGGNKTLIVEKNISLGGTSTNALVSPMMPSYVEHGTNFHAIEQSLLQLGCVTRDNQTEYVWYNSEQMSQSLEELYLSSGGKILYDATFIDCICVENQLCYIIVMTVEGLIAIEGKQFVDASGDAILSRRAGVESAHGDEEGNNQMSSLRFEMAGIDVEKFREYCLFLQDEFSPLVDGYFFEAAMVKGKSFKLEPIFQRGIERGMLKEEDLRYFQCFSIPSKKGCMTFNCPHLAALTDNTSAIARSRAIQDGRLMVRRLVLFLKSEMPGFEDAFLMKEATMLGVRESYRIIGKYLLNEEDYLRRARFSDGVVRGDWYIDVHSANKGLVHKDKFQRGEYYEIPYRSFVNSTICNLITVGRCISATFLMQASVRIIPTVIDMGQIAGEACVFGLANKRLLSEIDGSVLRRS